MALEAWPSVLSKIQTLVALGVLSKNLLRAKVTTCSTCLHGSMTKQSWRTKVRDSRRSLPPVTKPDDYISVDAMESQTPGFIAKLKGKLSKRRHTPAIVFKDHYSDLTYIYLREYNYSESIVNAKKEFEAFIRKQ